jgi:hypothetical protein
VKDIKVGVEKMTRNRRKMIKQTGDSLLLSKHSIQLSALFLLLSDFRLKVWIIVNNKQNIFGYESALAFKENFTSLSRLIY